MLDIRSGVFGENQGKGGGGKTNEGGLIIPLLMQNKPPVKVKVDDDRLNDLPYRPEEVTYIAHTLFAAAAKLTHPPFPQGFP